jgi:hypothetical protein
MDDTLKTFHAGDIDLSGVRIPPDLAGPPIVVH